MTGCRGRRWWLRLCGASAVFGCASLALTSGSFAAPTSCYGTFDGTSARSSISVGQVTQFVYADTTRSWSGAGTVSWGDGRADHFTVNQSVLHRYTRPGTYRETVTDALTWNMPPAIKCGGGVPCVRVRHCSDAGTLIGVYVVGGSSDGLTPIGAGAPASTPRSTAPRRSGPPSSSSSNLLWKIVGGMLLIGVPIAGAVYWFRQRGEQLIPDHVAPSVAHPATPASDDGLMAPGLGSMHVGPTPPTPQPAPGSVPQADGLPPEGTIERTVIDNEAAAANMAQKQIQMSLDAGAQQQAAYQRFLVQQQQQPSSPTAGGGETVGPEGGTPTVTPEAAAPQPPVPGAIPVYAEEGGIVAWKDPLSGVYFRAPGAPDAAPDASPSPAPDDAIPDFFIE